MSTRTKLAEKSEESEDYHNEWIRAQDESDIFFFVYDIWSINHLHHLGFHL